MCALQAVHMWQLHFYVFFFKKQPQASNTNATAVLFNFVRFNVLNDEMFNYNIDAICGIVWEKVARRKHAQPAQKRSETRRCVVVVVSDVCATVQLSVFYGVDAFSYMLLETAVLFFFFATHKRQLSLCSLVGVSVFCRC